MIVNQDTSLYSPWHSVQACTLLFWSWW